MARRVFSFTGFHKHYMPSDDRLDVSDVEDFENDSTSPTTQIRHNDIHQGHYERNSQNVNSLSRCVTSPNLSARKFRERYFKDYGTFLDEEARKYYACHTYETSDLQSKREREYRSVGGLSSVKKIKTPARSYQKPMTYPQVPRVPPAKKPPLKERTAESFRFNPTGTVREFRTLLGRNRMGMSCFTARTASSVGECAPVACHAAPIGPAESPEALMSIVSYDSPTTSAKHLFKNRVPRSISSALKRRRNVVRPTSARRSSTPKAGIRHIIKTYSWEERELSPISQENETVSLFNATPRKKTTSKKKKKATKSSRVKSSMRDVTTPVAKSYKQPYIASEVRYPVSQENTNHHNTPTAKVSDESSFSVQSWNQKRAMNYRSIASSFGRQRRARPDQTSKTMVNLPGSYAGLPPAAAKESSTYCPERPSLLSVRTPSFVHASIIPRGKCAVLQKLPQRKVVYQFQFKPQRVCLCRRERRRPPPVPPRGVSKTALSKTALSKTALSKTALSKSAKQPRAPTERYSSRYRFTLRRPVSRYAPPKVQDDDCAWDDVLGWGEEGEWEDKLSDVESPVLPNQLRPEELKFLARHAHDDGAMSEASYSSDLSSPTDSGELYSTNHPTTPQWSLNRSPC